MDLSAAAGGLSGSLIDAINVKVRDGQVGNQPFCAAIGVDLAGKRSVLGERPGRRRGISQVLGGGAGRFEEPRSA